MIIIINQLNIRERKKGQDKMRKIGQEMIYKAGAYMDLQAYPVYKKQGQRAKRGKPTSEVQQKINERNSKLKLTRLLHTNFTSDDIEIHLTYSEDCLPADAREALRDIQNYIRRLRKYYKGKELKYIVITETGAENGRFHHHITISGGVSRDILEEEWKKGFANSKRLQFTDKGLQGLANYMTKQKLAFRRWNCSKNLIKPTEKVRHNRVSQKKLKEMYQYQEQNGEKALINHYGDYFKKLYPDYRIIEVKIIANDVNKGYYMYAFGKKEE